MDGVLVLEYLRIRCDLYIYVLVICTWPKNTSISLALAQPSIVMCEGDSAINSSARISSSKRGMMDWVGSHG